MTEILFNQRKEIVVLEYVQYNDVDQLINAAFAGAPRGATVGPLRWVDGIVMLFNPLPATNEFLTRQLIEGRLYWDHLAFALMPRYVQNRISDTIGVSCSIVDVSNLSVFKDVAQSIRNKFLVKADI